MHYEDKFRCIVVYDSMHDKIVIISEKFEEVFKKKEKFPEPFRVNILAAGSIDACEAAFNLLMS